MKKPKIIVILGVTGSGKTGLSIGLAKKFNGEIISADSRQVYKSLDIGTDKIKNKEMKGVPHHLLDVASPKRFFSVSQYQKKSIKAILEITKREKTPFIVGGTGFYIQSIVDGIFFPKTKKNPNLRKKLAAKSPNQLFQILKTIDKNRAKNIDCKNSIRMIRAIEIAEELGEVPKLTKTIQPYDFLILGLKVDYKNIQTLCEKRFYEWIKEGLLKEIKDLKKLGLSWQKIESFGLYYTILAQYIQGKIEKKEAFDRSITSIQQYIKRQKTWFKRDARINWIKNESEAIDKIENFLKL